ncbi:MAG: hypothetical protein IPK14_05300 [Blastocatellia bacterium]|nr:hypothetical protein [Blastocatellia bacterium]
MDDKFDIEDTPKAIKSEEIESEIKSFDLAEKQLSNIVSSIDLETVTQIRDQIDNHYVASVVYKELMSNVNNRQELIDELKNKLIEQQKDISTCLSEQEEIKKQIVLLEDKQQECLKEYQEGAQELEEEVIEIDKQIIELEKQILELRRRKSEIAEQQEVRLKEQDNTQLEIQKEIDDLAKNNEELKEKEKELAHKLNSISKPENLSVLDRRIEDLIHHICAIFESPATNLTAKIPQDDLAQTPIFQLEPWAAEENRGLSKIVLPMGVKQVVLSLHIPGDKTFERYSAELYSSNGRRVWNSDKLEINGRAVVVNFNSTFFLSDDYEMRLKGRNTERHYTPIAEYYFNINKK